MKGYNLNSAKAILLHVKIQERYFELLQEADKKYGDIAPYIKYEYFYKILCKEFNRSECYICAICNKKITSIDIQKAKKYIQYSKNK